MSHASSRPGLSRSALFEVFEKRLMLTAQPIVPFGGVEVLPTFDVPITSHVLDLDDASVQRPELLLEEVQSALEEIERPVPTVGDIETTLADVHYSTGLTYLRNEYGFDGTGQTVAVIDSGIAYDHYALGGGFGEGYRVVGGRDFTEENDGNPYDDAPGGFHGTHVAGIIGSDDPIYQGVAPGVDLVALRVFNDQGEGWFSWVEDSLQWVHDNRDSFANPITTVNLSIGCTWNADSVPNWATLENEFAQLEQDGIFIAVSAGNSFGSYNATGLSYPAASSYVVPVASTDNAGTMSGFSQRNDRVIAAPGQSITSTIPDYLFGFDGVTDDWGTASGTSMAAPYVAGASVLLREAMEFVGYENITQDGIYDLMRDTADMVYDSATRQYYHNLNLESAIAAIMPEDDFGSSAATAFDLGSFDDSVQLSGLIGSLTDRDYFTFTAESNGVATFDVEWAQQLGTDWQLNQAGGVVDGDSLTFDVVSGRTYTVSLGTDGGLGFYDVNATFEGGIADLGVVEQLEVADQSLYLSEKWFELTASRDGVLTVEAMLDSARGTASLELYNASNQLIASSATRSDVERVDVTVGAGETFTIRIAGVNEDIDLRLTNLVQIAGDTADVFGTAGDDVFAFAAGTTHHVTVNGVAYQFAGSSISTINFHGGAGTDEIRMTGTAADETATLRPGSADLIGPQYDAHAEGIKTITIIAGGGYDVAMLYDSAGDDAFHAKPTWATMLGNGFYSRVQGFRYVYAYSGEGGTDKAFMYDSAGDDQFHAKPTWSAMLGDGFYNFARGFRYVYAYSTVGGTDNAYLYDSVGNDQFHATPTWGAMLGDGFYNFAGGFRNVSAYSTAGGSDTAYLYDSAGDDQFQANPAWAAMIGNGFQNLAREFRYVHAYSTAGGTDRAFLCDSADDDQFHAAPAWAVMFGDDFYNLARGFRYAYAYSTAGGTDRAYLYDSAGDDQFHSRPTWAAMLGNGFYNFAREFRHVYAYSTAGGTDQAYLSGLAAVDSVYGTDDNASLFGRSITRHARGFDRVRADHTAGSPPSVELDAIDYVFELLEDV